MATLRSPSVPGMSAALLFVMMQAEPTASFAQRVSAELEGGGGVETSTRSDASAATVSGKAQIGLTLSERAVGWRPLMAIRARNDTDRSEQLAAGPGLVFASTGDAPLKLSLLAIGGVTKFPVVTSLLIPMAGGEASLSKRLGDAFAVAGTLGGAAVFPGTTGDTVDASTPTLSSYRRVGFEGWGRLSATFFVVHRDLDLGIGPFLAATMTSVRHEVLSPTVMTDTRVTDVAAVAGLQLVMMK